MLCQQCEKIFQGPFMTGHPSWTLPGKVHYPKASQLEDSGKAGCRLCALVHWKLSNQGIAPDTEVKYGFRGSNWSCLKEQLVFWGKTIGYQSAEFNVLQKSETHIGCHLASEDFFLPTRLLDVGSEESGHSLRLCTSSQDIDSGDKPSYLPLNHSCGAAKFFQLKKENYEDLSQKIVFDELPLTFQQAIEVTRKLGVRYLWIDSLCIVQNDSDDWRHEAGLIHRVYKSALCNIASTEGSLNPGLFRDRKLSLISTIKVSIPKLSKLKEDGIEDDEFYLTDRRGFIEDISNAPLNQLSWVMQEQLLSPRILHFSSTQLYFEYNTARLSETFPTSGPPKAILEKLELAKHGGLPDLTTEVSSWYAGLGRALDYLLFSRYGRWNRLVEIYTTCQLNFQGDKLIALSGMAQEMQKMLQDDYLACLWRRDLPYHLLWHSTEASVVWSKVSPELKPIAYRAPSWSWASAQEPVYLYDFEEVAKEDEILVDILHASTETTGEATGQVTGGLLEIRGVLRQLLWFEETKPGPRYFYYRMTVSQRESLPLDIDNKGNALSEDVWLMPILRSRPFPSTRILSGEEQDFQAWVYHCLVLERTATADDAELYQRVGYFRTMKDQLSDWMFEVDQNTGGDCLVIRYENVH